MIRILLLSVITLAFTSALTDSMLDGFWKAYKQFHNKQYDSQDEEIYRQSIWERNLHAVQKHNMEADLGLHSFTMGMNSYGDLTNEEMNKYLNGLLQVNLTKSQPSGMFLTPSNLKVPESLDWRDFGYVTPVKDQGGCGSCWAFSATGSLEGQHFKKEKKLVSISEQNLVDCSRKEGNHGCSGGFMDLAFKYVQNNKGIDTETSYPYQAKDLPCRFKASTIGATDTGFIDISGGNETALLEAVASIGPISVGMDASRPTFSQYRDGVYSDSTCSSIYLDHGVLVVGYGTTSTGEKYWIVKNSWGTSWGNMGYFKIARGQNMCGIANVASYPLV